MNTDEQKRAAGEAAAALVERGAVVGLGTGSTAVWFVRALAARRLGVACVATSAATAALAAGLGLRLLDLDEAGRIDLVIDGADEIAPDLGLIKGGGAALLGEKLVWEASARRVVVADAGKRVARLGRFPLPIEVVPFGHGTTAARIRSVLDGCGIAARPRLREADGTPVRTDNGGLIYDVPCGAIADPGALARALKATTGVVEHGLFLGLASEAFVGAVHGVEHLTRGNA